MPARTSEMYHVHVYQYLYLDLDVINKKMCVFVYIKLKNIHKVKRCHKEGVEGQTLYVHLHTCIQYMYVLHNNVCKYNYVRATYSSKQAQIFLLTACS